MFRGRKRVIRGSGSLGLGLSMVLLLGGCGGGSGGGGGDSSMAIGEMYPVQSHDRLVVTSAESTTIRVEHDLETDQRWVTLLSGSADLLRGGI